MVMGVVLPDFVRNAHKDWNLNPQRQEDLFMYDELHWSILRGWRKHLEVDRIFHSSHFFRDQTAVLKQIILPVFEDSPVKPFFLAHIGLELILDHLLVVNGLVNINTFYEQLNRANTPVLKSFLAKAGLKDEELFDQFLTRFISSRYLLSYQKIENITYALNRICMRLWRNPFTEAQLALLTQKLELYKVTVQEDFKLIFDVIEASV